MENRERPKLQASTIIFWNSMGLVWSASIRITIGLAIAYVVWLVLFDRWLVPIPVNGAIIKLDLLQTIAFLVALTAFVGAITVTAVNKLYELLTTMEVGNIRLGVTKTSRNKSSSESVPTQDSHRGSGLLPRMIDLVRRVDNAMEVVWFLLHVPIAGIILRQGFASARLLSGEHGPTVIAVNGWLAVACAGYWVALVITTSATVVSAFGDVRHVGAVQDATIVTLTEEQERLVREIERLTGKGG